MMTVNLANNLPMKAYKLIDRGCPSCGAQAGGFHPFQYHSVSVWCMRCKWAANWRAILPRITEKGKLKGDIHSGLAG